MSANNFLAVFFLIVFPSLSHATNTEGTPVSRITLDLSRCRDAINKVCTDQVMLNEGLEAVFRVLSTEKPNYGKGYLLKSVTVLAHSNAEIVHQFIVESRTTTRTVIFELYCRGIDCELLIKNRALSEIRLIGTIAFQDALTILEFMRKKPVQGQYKLRSIGYVADIFLPFDIPQDAKTCKGKLAWALMGIPVPELGEYLIKGELCVLCVQHDTISILYSAPTVF